MGLLETVLAFAQVLTGQGNACWRKGSERGESLLQEGEGEGITRIRAQLDLATGAHAPRPPPQAAWPLGVHRQS